MNVSGKKIIVLGLGISGMDVATLLKSKGADVLVRDNGNSSKLQQRAETLRAQGIDVELGDSVQGTAKFDLGVLSPGIDPSVPLVETLRNAHLPLLGELEMAYRFCECPIVAITGANGKTTTTELIAAVLQTGGKRAMASGNIGTAFSAAVRQSAELDVMVLEVSSFQLEYITDFRPRISVYLNLSPNHLDRYHSMREYELAKWQMFKNQTEDDYAIVNAAVALPPTLKAKKITFNGFGKLADYHYADGQLYAHGEPVLEMERTNLTGPHNAENMLAALAVADLYNVSRACAIEALCNYVPRPHRCEKIAEINGVTWLNDSKATNVDAMEKALLAMRSSTVLIAGGKDKGGDFGSLRPLLREKARAVIIIGQIQDKLYELWHTAVPTHRALTLADAVEKAQRLAHRGDAVLLSPGCSSYDMFEDYQDRGDQFRQLVLSKQQQPKTNQ